MDRKPLETGIIQELPSEIQIKWFNSQKNGTFGRMGVNGEGSCFFHSVLSILNPYNFINLTEDKQIELANKFRCSFSQSFTLDEFDQLTRRTEEKNDEPNFRQRGEERLKKIEREYKNAQKVFCQPKVWADETNIRIVSNLLNLNLIFVDFSKKNEVYCSMHGDESLKNLNECHPVNELQKTGIIAWIERSHFEPIVRIDNKSTGEITTLFDPENPKDSEFLLHFMSTYKQECNL